MPFDPIAEIIKEHRRARRNNDPNTGRCFLATARGGQAFVRTLSLCEITGEGLSVLVCSISPKWKQLQDSPGYELLLYWPTVFRQYRLQGAFQELPQEKTEMLWRRKTYPLKILDHYYTRGRRQSRTLDSEQVFLTAIRKLRKRFPDPDAVPVPPTARGLLFTPARIDVWRNQDDASMPRRFLYVRKNGRWSRRFLVP